jgi:hypothetical protein
VMLVVTLLLVSKFPGTHLGSGTGYLEGDVRSSRKVLRLHLRLSVTASFYVIPNAFISFLITQ